MCSARSTSLGRELGCPGLRLRRCDYDGMSGQHLLITSLQRNEATATQAQLCDWTNGVVPSARGLASLGSTCKPAGRLFYHKAPHRSAQVPTNPGLASDRSRSEQREHASRRVWRLVSPTVLYTSVSRRSLLSAGRVVPLQTDVRALASAGE